MTDTQAWIGVACYALGWFLMWVVMCRDEARSNLRDGFANPLSGVAYGLNAFITAFWPIVLVGMAIYGIVVVFKKLGIPNLWELLMLPKDVRKAMKATNDG